MYHPNDQSPIIIAPSCAIANGCLYIAKYHSSNGNSYGLYKIDLNNSANISLVAPNGNFGNISNSSSLKSLNGFVFGTNGYIDGNDNYHAFKSSVNAFVDSRLCASGMTAFYCSNGTDYIYIIAPYLATINNIVPVTKTADKTMKITYTVTES